MVMRPAAPRWVPWAWVGLTAIAVLVLDQVSKGWVLPALGLRTPGDRLVLLPGALTLDVVRNPGSAFGFFRDAGWVLAALAAVVSIAILFLVPRLQARPAGAPWPLLLALGLLLGGALGNLADRVQHGYVVDFITPAFARVTLGDTAYQFPTFNVADSGITVGVLVLLVGLLLLPESRAADDEPVDIGAELAEDDAGAGASDPAADSRRLTAWGLVGGLAAVGGIWAGAVLLALRRR